MYKYYDLIYIVIHISDRCLLRMILTLLPRDYVQICILLDKIYIGTAIRNLNFHNKILLSFKRVIYSLTIFNWVIY